MQTIPIKYSRGKTAFISNEVDINFTLLDFWAWAFSDVLTNTARGILAEFIVAKALDIDVKKPREAWAKFDLEYKDCGIEVKSASYHQRWFQKRMSTISFNVPKRRAWNADTNQLEEKSQRQADFYVLSLLSEKDRTKINPLNINQWKFWIIETEFFNNRKRSQHSITYNSLIKEIGEPVCYHQIKKTIDDLIKK